jgi:hypothetical protein
MPHGYKILNLRQNTHDMFRFRTNIVTNEYAAIIYAVVDNERHRSIIKLTSIMDSKTKVTKGHTK